MLLSAYEDPGEGECTPASLSSPSSCSRSSCFTTHPFLSLSLSRSLLSHPTPTPLFSFPCRSPTSSPTSTFLSRLNSEGKRTGSEPQIRVYGFSCLCLIPRCLNHKPSSPSVKLRWEHHHPSAAVGSDDWAVDSSAADYCTKLMPLLALRHSKHWLPMLPLLLLNLLLILCLLLLLLLLLLLCVLVWLHLLLLLLLLAVPVTAIESYLTMKAGSHSPSLVVLRSRV